jgi:lysozyme family protein
MPDSFTFCVDHLIDEFERGYVNDPNDPGGETKWGISKRSYPNVDIKNLTREGAVEIYRKDYWQWCNCDEMPLPVALMVFDAAVNQGKGRACCWLQDALGVDVDGHVGPNTLQALGTADLLHVLGTLAGRRATAYMMTPETQRQRFARGWGNRLGHLTVLCAQLAS